MTFIGRIIIALYCFVVVAILLRAFYKKGARATLLLLLATTFLFIGIFFALADFAIMSPLERILQFYPEAGEPG